MNSRNQKGQTVFETLLKQLHEANSHIFKMKCGQILTVMDFATPYFEAYKLQFLDSCVTEFKSLLDQHKSEIFLEDYVKLYNTFTDIMSRLQKKFIAFTFQIKLLHPAFLNDINELINATFPKVIPENLDAREFLNDDDENVE